MHEDRLTGVRPAKISGSQTSLLIRVGPATTAAIRPSIALMPT